MPRSFAHPVAGSIYLDEIDLNPLDLDGWNDPLPLGFDQVNWPVFLSDLGFHPDLLSYWAQHFRGHEGVLRVASLVHVVQLFHRHAIRLQGQPLNVDLTNQLRRVRSAAAKLAHLAQGGDGKDQPTAKPEWYRAEYGIDIDGDGSLHPTLVRATPDVHPRIHRALHVARMSGFPSGMPQGEAERKAWNEVGFFFAALRYGLKIVDQAIEQSEAQSGQGNAAAHRPSNGAQKWALSRLLWIWRDIVREPIAFRMITVRERVELEIPEPGPCLQFVIDAMEGASPIGPHQYRALQTELKRVNQFVPEESLIIS